MGTPEWRTPPICLRRILAVVQAQAEDPGLWFEAATAPEAYLQQEVRRLHAVIEEEAALAFWRETWTNERPSFNLKGK
jgi:hypothetical protein